MISESVLRPSPVQSASFNSTKQYAKTFCDEFVVGGGGH